MKKTNRGKIKVYFFLPTLHGGGAERVTINILETLDRVIYSPKLILSKKVGPYIKEVPLDVPIIDLHTQHVRYALLKLAKLLQRDKPDILFSSLYHANVIALMSRIIARNSTNVIVPVHSTPSQAVLEKQPLKAKFILRFERFLYSKADKVIVVSKGVQKDVVDFLGIRRDKTALIYNPIVDEKLIQLSQEKINHPWFDDFSTPTIVAAGRLHEAKDYPTLLKAFKLIKREMPVKLIILGEGRERRCLESLSEKLNIGKDMEMPGFKDNPYKYMANASVFVLSSTREGLPTVLVEAMACGTPVVSTDCPSGPNEIITHGVNGLLVPSSNAEALAEAVLRILKNKELATKLAEAGKERAHDFEVTKIVKQYERLFYSLARGKDDGK